MAIQILLLAFSLMPGIRLILVFTLVFLCARLFLERTRHRNLPPGPWGLPLLGANFRLGADPCQSLLEMSRKYGKIFSLRVGPRLTVVITDPALAREAYGKRADVTSARESVTLDWLDVSGSIVYSSSSDVKPLRQFLLRALRDFGLGKKNAETLITEEARCLCAGLDREKGKTFDPRNLLQMAVANIICTFCFGQRFDYASAELMQLISSLQAVSHISGLSITRDVPILLLSPRFKAFRAAAEMYRRMLQSLVAQHKMTCDPNRPLDVIERLFQETAKADSRFSFGDDRIFRTMMDMFGAGADTTSSTLQFAVWHMVTYPDVQKRVRNEIFEEIGTERPPKWSDRHRLPFTCATINEVLRLTHPVPLSVIHRATASFELAGYTIPEGTELMAPIWAMNMDPDTWKDPERFNPERFLSEDERNVVLPEGFLPFGTGSRMCIGEGLARMEVFIFLSTILQRFTFDLPPEVPKSCEPRFGFFLSFPSQMQICVTPNY